MVITETRLTKKVIADEEGTVLLLPRMLVEKSLQVERRRFYVLLRILQLTDSESESERLCREP